MGFLEPILSRTWDPVYNWIVGFFSNEKKINEIRLELFDHKRIFESYNWVNAATYEVALKFFESYKPHEFIFNNATAIFTKI